MFDRIRYSVRKFIEKRKAIRNFNIEHEKLNKYYGQMRRTINYDLKMSKQSEDGIWLWDTNLFVDQFMQEVKDHHIEIYTPNCSFVECIMFIEWLSAVLKMHADENIVNLMQEYTKYGIKHYDAKAFGYDILHSKSYNVYPLMIYHNYRTQKYKNIVPAELFELKNEFLDYYNEYYAPYFMTKPGNLIITKTINDGTDIVFEEEKLPEFKSREEEEAFLKKDLEEFQKRLADMPDYIMKNHEEIMRRFNESGK